MRKDSLPGHGSPQSILSVLLLPAPVPDNQRAVDEFRGSLYQISPPGNPAHRK